jgi:hypothetical protein
VDIERIRHGDAIGQHFAQCGRPILRDGGKIEIERARDVGGHRHVAAGCPHDEDFAARQRTAHVEQLQGLTERAQGIAARDAGLPAECIEYGIRARQGTRVAVRGTHRRRRSSRFHRRNGLAQRTCLVGGARKCRCVLDPFQIQPECGDAGIFGENIDQILDRNAGLVPDREQATDGQRAIVEHQGERDRAALADQRNAALHSRAHDLIGHHRRSIEEIDEAVAVRPEKGQGAGLLD